MEKTTQLSGDHSSFPNLTSASGQELVSSDATREGSSLLLAFFGLCCYFCYVSVNNVISIIISIYN